MNIIQLAIRPQNTFSANAKQAVGKEEQTDCNKFYNWNNLLALEN